MTRMRPACTVLLLVLAGALCGVSPARAAFDPLARTIGGTSWHSFGVALGDLDRDGDLDAVFATDLQEAESLVICLNDGGGFASPPAQVLAGLGFHTDIAVGDIDGDGWLDLVAATKFGDPLKAWLSVGGTFSDAPTWQSTAMDETRGIALADFDGDGFLDLACANRNAPDAVYRGTADGFEDVPVWQSSDAVDSRDVAWGDLNGDGLLDLAIGRADAPNVAWLGGPGGLAATPAWESDDARYTVGVALGDLDADGDLDIICANSSLSHPCATYPNLGGVVATTPVDLGGNRFASAVAVGDVDNDGDLDIAFAVFAGNDRLHLNDAGTIDPTGAAISSDRYDTEDAVFADVDGDGFLDLVCASSGQTDVWYRNLAGPFAGVPIPLSPTIAGTRAVLLADMNGDGRRDLLVGDDSLTTADSLYLGLGDAFDAGAAWGPATTHRTYALAVGDVDGDGHPDLVCAHDDVSPALYLNGPGGLATIPAWTAYGHAGYEARDVVLTDIDGDGDLDLLIANKAGPVTLHLNDRGTLAVAPDWSSPWPAADGDVSTFAIAVGDVDDDGDPDLVCANNVNGIGDAYNRLFLNNGNGFLVGQQPDWIAGSVDNSRDVALGDLDGDGLPDLVFGNGSSTPQANTIYFNRGGYYPATYDWDDAAPDHTEAVRLFDCDADGDLDLFCGNWQEPSRLYENLDGALDPSPRWTLDGTLQTACAASADIDDDGDMDLVIGVSQAVNLLAAGGAFTPEATGAGSPAGPDLAPHLSGVTAIPAGVNAYRVDLRVHDREGDPVWIVPEFQFAGDPMWLPADNSQGRTIGPLAADADGVDHSFLWDIGLAPIDRREAVLRLRTVSLPRTVSTVDRVPAYLEPVGTLAVARPEIAVAPATLVFPTVSFGDTVTVALTVRNSGTMDLGLWGFDTATGELGVDPGYPANLAPGASILLTVRLAPRTSADVGDDLGVLSSDPLTPRAGIGVATDIRSLAFDSRLLASSDTIPLGDAVTVIATPEPLVHVEDGYLFHRVRGSAAFDDSIRLARSEGDFIAVIPGDAVTEAGLEYYLRLENSGVFATDPPGAPAAAVHARTVEAPQGVTALARATAGDGFAAGRSVRVDVSLPEGAEFVTGSLHYRVGGQPDWTEAACDIDAGGPFSVIPDSLVGPRGVEYWIETTTLTAALTDPPSWPAATPLILPVSVDNLVEPRIVPARQYRMLSVPLVFPADGGTLEGLLYEQAGYGSYDPTRWRCFRYDPTLGRYLELPESDEAFRPEPGRAFWLIANAAEPLTTAPATGLSPTTAQPWPVVLQPGWNQVGHPFDFPVEWTSATVEGVPVLDAQNALVLEAPVAWDWENQQYAFAASRLEPFDGYWVHNLTARPVTLAIAATAAEAKVRTAAADPGAGWSVGIVAACGDARDSCLVAVVRPGAEPDRDRFDVSLPPANPSWQLLAHFPRSSWRIGPGRYAVDAQPDPATDTDPGQTGRTWPFDVAKNWDRDGVADEVELRFPGLAAVPPRYGIVLEDRITGRTVDLRLETTYTYNLGRRAPVTDQADARFRLMVGLPAYITAQTTELPPSRTALLPNRPNPFNPATMIRYELATDTKVIVRVYDTRGRLVRTLVSQAMPAGRHEVLWDGRDDSGHGSAAGVYVGRLTTSAGDRSVHKMTLIR